MAIPLRVEWDDASGQWVEARNKPGAITAQWNGVEWVRGQNPEGPGALARGLATGIESTKGLAFDVLPAMIQSAFGYEEAAQKNLDSYKKRMDELAARNLLAKTSYQDVKDVSTLGSYVGEALGEAVPSLATALLGGVGIGAAATRLGAGRLLSEQVAKRAAALEAQAAATGTTLSREAAIKAATSEVSRNVGNVAGAFGGSAILNVPESFASLAEEGQKSLGTALVVGSLKSTLDALGPIRLLNRTRGAEFSDRVTDVLSARLLKGRPGAAGALGGVLETTALEGLTEGTQELIDQAAKALLADKSINWNEVIDAALKGGIGAAPVGGAAGAIGARARAAAEAQRTQQMEEYQQRLASEQAEQEQQRRAEEAEKLRAEEQQAYVARRFAGEEVPASRPLTELDYLKKAASEASNRFDNVRIDIGETKKGPAITPNSQDLTRLALDAVKKGEVNPETNKPYTVPQRIKAAKADILQDVRDTAQRMRTEDEVQAREVTAPSIAPREDVVQGPSYRRQQAQRLVDEVQQDPGMLEIPGVREQFAQAQSLLRGEADVTLQQRREERELLGPMVGQPFTGTPTREAPAPTLTQEETQALQGAGMRLDQIAKMPYEEARTRAQVAMREEQERAQPTQPPTPKLGQQGTITLENALKEVPPGGTVSLPALQSELQRAGIRDVGMQELKQILEGYAPAKNVTPAGMLRVPESMRLVRSKDGTFRKPRSGTQEEAYVAPEVEEQPRRGVERRPADLPTESTQISRPLTEVQGGLQNPPAGYGRRDFAVLHNAIVRRGPSKILTRNELETVAQREFDSPREVASVWEGLVNSGAVRKEGLGYRVRKDAPIISEFQPEDVGTTTKKPTEVAEEPSTYAPPKTKVSKGKSSRIVMPKDVSPEVAKNVEAAQNMMDRQEKINDAIPNDYSCR